MKRKTILPIILSAAVVLAAGAAGIVLGVRNNRAIQAQMLSVDVQPAPYKELEEGALNAAADFSARFFHVCRDPEAVNNCLSPLSAYFALGLIANGADTVTLEQLEDLLGGGPGTLPSINATCRALLEDLSADGDTGRISFANSIWFREDGFTAYDSFLQDNTAYFGAQAYRSDFRKPDSAAADMNRWIREQTDGLIDEIILPEEIKDISMMFLYNTVLFDMKWAEEITDQQVSDDVFTAYDGTERTIPFLHSEGAYLCKEGLFQGFRKSYNGRCAFVGLLPAGNSTPEELAASLDGATLRQLARSSQGIAQASFPEFQFEQTADLKDGLQSLGLANFFEGTFPDLTRMGKSDSGRLEVAKILQKTYVDVNQRGTKAAAATRVDIVASCAVSQSEPIPVVLDRPFLFLIQDTVTGLPLFMGVVNSIQ